MFIKAFKTIMKSHRVRIPKYEHLPIRLRPWFLLFTTLVMFVLAFLGFTNFSRSLPLNDKALHFLCFGLATAVFYFIFDVEEDQRRVWFWRNSALIITGFVCFFCGGILSEFVQSMLPYKEFQFGDVVANLLGSSVGLLASYHMERYYRKRREIARLYQPLDSGSMSDLEDEDDGMPLLPTHSGAAAPKGGQKGVTRLTDVWDEREELFGIGGDSDDEDAATPRVAPRQPAPQHHPDGNAVPKIFVSAD
jgi:VanZ family protein